MHNDPQTCSFAHLSFARLEIEDIVEISVVEAAAVSSNMNLLVNDLVKY